MSTMLDIELGYRFGANKDKNTSFKTNVSETAGRIHLSDNVRCNGT